MTTKRLGALSPVTTPVVTPRPNGHFRRTVEKAPWKVPGDSFVGQEPGVLDEPVADILRAAGSREELEKLVKERLTATKSSMSWLERRRFDARTRAVIKTAQAELGA